MGALIVMKAGKWILTGIVFSSAFLASSCDNRKKPVREVVPTVAEQNTIPDFIEDYPGFSGDNAYSRTAYFVSLGERTPGSKALEESVLFLERELKRFGWSTLRQSFEQETVAGKKKFTNLRARISGRESEFELPSVGVVGCHIDTKVFDFPFVGANDGASHMGVMLELARIMGKEPEKWSGVELVFFDGEESFGESMILGEDGLYGSMHYVNSLGSSLPKWMLNLDMLGARQLKIAIPEDTPQELYVLYRATIKELKESEDDFSVAYGTIYDDHYPFQLAGVPAINLIADFRVGGWWHTPRDTMDIISARSLDRTGKFAYVLLDRMHAAGVWKTN